MGQCNCAGEIREGRHKSPRQSLINVLSAPSTVHLKRRFAFRWTVLPHGGHFINNFVNMRVGEACPKFAICYSRTLLITCQIINGGSNTNWYCWQSFTDNPPHLVPRSANDYYISSLIIYQAEFIRGILLWIWFTEPPWLFERITVDFSKLAVLQEPSVFSVLFYLTICLVSWDPVNLSDKTLRDYFD